MRLLKNATHSASQIPFVCRAVSSFAGSVSRRTSSISTPRQFCYDIFATPVQWSWCWSCPPLLQLRALPWNEINKNCIRNTYELIIFTNVREFDRFSFCYSILHWYYYGDETYGRGVQMSSTHARCVTPCQTPTSTTTLYSSSRLYTLQVLQLWSMSASRRDPGFTLQKYWNVVLHNIVHVFEHSWLKVDSYHIPVDQDGSFTCIDCLWYYPRRIL